MALLDTQHLLTTDGLPIHALQMCENAAAAAGDWLLHEHGVRTVIVPGSHGSGKSTLLKLLDGILRHHGASVSWFNGWRHKEDLDPFASILFALWDELDHEGNFRCPPNETVDAIVASALRQKGYPSTTAIRQRDFADASAGEKALLLATDTVAQIVMNSAHTTELAYSSQLLSGAGQVAESKYQRQRLLDRARSYQFPKRFREQLEDIVQAVARRRTEAKRPTFLMIDDIDRCRTELGLGIVEIIGRFFRVPGLITIVGLDETIARSWVDQVYKSNVEPKTYMDKLFDRRILGVEDRARTVWAELLAHEWRATSWVGLNGKAHANLADKAIISATRLLRIHGGSDIRLVRRVLADVRETIRETEEYVTTVTLTPDIVRLAVLCGYLVHEAMPGVIERIADLRLLDARVDMVEQLMAIGPAWLEGTTPDEDLVWLRDFLHLRPDQERYLATILDIRHFLPTPVLTKVGANLVLLGMGLR
ncbi:MAG: hypothetical protein IT462_09445 [Planctomycetes bacterium]|nr:hypothetical protein [Planctomycetota bacterium]